MGDFAFAKVMVGLAAARMSSRHENSVWRGLLAFPVLWMYDFRTFNVNFIGVRTMTELGAKVKEALEAFWDERAIPAHGGAEAASVDDLVGPVESMTAVDILVTLDSIVGMKLPNTVVQAGGYQTRDEFINKLGAAVMAHVAEKTKP
jgi:hypothetical protein